MSDEALDDLVDADAFGFGAVVEEDAMAQRRNGERLDVIDRHVRATAQERAGLASKDEELRGACACTPAHPVVDERRHVFFIKPDIVVLVDDLQAMKPSTFQFMLHGQQEFKADGAHLTLDRGKAGVQVDYISPTPVKSRQWTGYDPLPDYAYLASVKNPRTPEQWHVETATTDTATELTVLTVMRVCADGKTPSGQVRMKSAGEYEIGPVTLKLDGRKSAIIRRQP